ncbi:MAG: alpha amylase C-terminal domain-containing protein, partial [Cocleimonas sp.]|nr:alpha amylase C-terminal domain-containing protein [Cocleimonas sp.]
DWALLATDTHQGIKKVISDLNTLYKNESALHQLDFSSEGFQWIDCHDSSQSVLSFLRWNKDRSEHVVCILNFTPLVRENYRLGVPASRNYQEILNTDSEYYAGSNCGNSNQIITEGTAWSGFDYSINIILPPLGALFLKVAT